MPPDPHWGLSPDPAEGLPSPRPSVSSHVANYTQSCESAVFYPIYLWLSQNAPMLSAWWKSIQSFHNIFTISFHDGQTQKRARNRKTITNFSPSSSTNMTAESGFNSWMWALNRCPSQPSMLTYIHKHASPMTHYNKKHTLPVVNSVCWTLTE